ncbi:haloalkane dehalogenase [Marinobacter fuscus]|uniref:Haloalkane dehalogenase n=1 Tax=Marinobacter fuscus TaxID=2109942 RepID=A0A2T1KK60_9GAMM|nr:haloalkane dehalogenase [Marinobacter fuscus]PSF10524.1 haloalkane dehalogenase [Marinobacter fuscus]
MRILRTDEARFAGLPDYPFSACYHQISPDLRMHYVDEGNPAAAPVIMLHGEPSWSYIYRHMIPVIAAAGHRVLAPDLIGFGKSDKPARVEDYSDENHMAWLSNWLEALSIENATLVCQNWGSLLGLRLAASHQRRFSRIIVANGMLPTGDHRPPAIFRVWKAFASHSPWFPVSRLIQLGTERTLSNTELAAYEAPFPDARYKAGARAFPALIPTSPQDPVSSANREAWRTLEKWRKPFITCFSNGDPITRGGDRHMQRRIPGAFGQPHITLNGGHFLQEDCPREFARVILDALKAELAA